jgi:uncharacterized protein YraI
VLQRMMCHRTGSSSQTPASALLTSGEAAVLQSCNSSVPVLQDRNIGRKNEALTDLVQNLCSVQLALVGRHCP